MCKVEFEDKDLDFLGRCTPCFHKFMRMTDDEKKDIKGKLGVPFTPGYDTTWNK
jgi:hypothetical protein